MMLTPDEKQADIYKDVIEPNLKPGNVLAFAHGFNIHFKQIVPPADVDVIMIAPKGPGHTVRRPVRRGSGRSRIWLAYIRTLPARLWTSLWHTLAVSAAAVPAFIESTFKTETETDLFGEQCCPLRRRLRADEGWLRDPG